MSRLRLLLIAENCDSPQCPTMQQQAALSGAANFEVLKVCSGWAEAEAELDSLNPDVTVIFVGERERASQNGDGQLPQLLNGLRCVLVTGADQVPHLQAKLQGANQRAVAAQAPLRELCYAICDVADDGLSDRERDVLRLIARGYTNKEIAGRLELSVKSVEKYKTRSHEKLGLRSRANAVTYAIARGWLLE